MRNRIVSTWMAAAILTFSSSAQAGHHTWDFTEIFSNDDGTVQYIEMFTSGVSEDNVGPFTITSGGKTFTFVTDLPSTVTTNTYLLVATAAFASQPGAPAPDYTMQDGFIDVAGGTLNYSGDQDIWTHGSVPTDGVSALARNGSTPTNSPTNFSFETGSIDLSPEVPSASAWAAMALIGAMLVSGSSMLRRRQEAA